jgi:hypothetical protein
VPTFVQAVADLLGLETVSAPPPKWEAVIGRALGEDWPLLVIHVPGRLHGRPPAGLSGFLQRGGVLLIVNEPGDGALPDLRWLSAELGVDLPRFVRGIPVGGTLRFTDAMPEVTGGFTGASVSRVRLDACLQESASAVPLALIEGSGREPVLAVAGTGRGAVLLSAASQQLPGPLRDHLGPDHWPALLPPLLLMRALYGRLTWQPPAPMAELIIDDPALRGGRLGLDYDRLLDLADHGGYHVTIATIPRELRLAEDRVIRLLKTRSERLSACYHGWAHLGYEFYLPDEDGHGRRARLRRQRRAVGRAAAAGREFHQGTGWALDRILVFPHGIGSADILPSLSTEGFLGSCNFDDRDPLGAGAPSDPDLGLRPADTAWGGVPLLWRRALGDPRLLVDAALGRPLISFSHRRALGPDHAPFAEQAARIAAVAPRARWCRLETIALHAYLVRWDVDEGWQALMTADEICLHNDGSEPRRYTVRRPHLPGGYHRAITVDVPAGGNVRVRVERRGHRRLPFSTSRCELAPLRAGAGQRIEVVHAD